MKKLFFLFGIFLFLSCSSDDNGQVGVPQVDNPIDVVVTPVFDPHVTVNGSNFEIKLAGIYSHVFEGRKFTQFVLDYTDDVCVRCGTPPNYKRILLNINSDEFESIEGTYDLSEYEPESRNMSGGYYLSGYPIYLYAGLVTVTKLGEARYKLEFNGVKGRFYANNASPTDIEGYFDGDFTTRENRFWS